MNSWPIASRCRESAEHEPETQGASFVPNANELTQHSLLCRGHRPQALSLHGSSLPLGLGRHESGPVVRVRTAKSSVASDHLLHAHFVVGRLQL
jgi:hypothetical protein